MLQLRAGQNRYDKTLAAPAFRQLRAARITYSKIWLTFAPYFRPNIKHDIKSKKSPLLAAETRALGSPEGSNAMLPSGRRSRGFAAQAKSIKETISAACGRVVKSFSLDKASPEFALLILGKFFSQIPHLARIFLKWEKIFLGAWCKEKKF